MKKLLLLLFSCVAVMSMSAQKVVLDFTDPVGTWKLPVKADAVTAATQFSNGTYTITLSASTAAYAGGSEKNGYTHLFIGKEGSTLTLPSFDFAVGRIEVVGNNGASAATGMNIYVGEEEASTATTGSVGTNNYVIAEGKQTVGTVYTLKVTTAHNAQITKINIYEVGETEPTEAFEAPLTDGQGNWTFEDEVKPEELTYIWSQSSSYGMKASAYANSTRYVTKSYLVSPELELESDAVLTFDHVQRYATENPADQLTLAIREGKGAWQALAIPTYSDGTNWNFVGSGEISLADYAGKTVQLGWCYTSTEEVAATWEIKNVKVTNATASEPAPTLKDPSNTLETAYTIDQAIEIIDHKAEYDMSKEVFVKGVITSIKSIDVEKYERAQYYIGATVDAEKTIQVYNGYYLEGAAFTANDQIKVGDEVVVLGKLTLYGTTYEIDQNNKLVSLNGQTASGISAITVAQQQGRTFDLQGRQVKAIRGLFIQNGKKIIR